jgi:hypothetical protein
VVILSTRSAGGAPNYAGCDRCEFRRAERHLMLSRGGDRHDEPVPVSSPGNGSGINSAMESVDEQCGRPATSKRPGHGHCDSGKSPFSGTICVTDSLPPAAV